jgi:flagellin FlaB
MKKDMAFSGLEAAIVLIAFVVVAAVFSYVMLGAGFFATSKSQEVTYSGIKQTTSNAVVDGNMYGSMSGGLLNTLTFYVKVPEGGETIKLDQIQYLYSSNFATPTIPSISTGSSGSLAPGSRTKVILSSLTGPSAGSTFSVEVKPRVGASTLIQRTLSSGYTGGVIY